MHDLKKLFAQIKKGQALISGSSDCFMRVPLQPKD